MKSFKQFKVHVSGSNGVDCSLDGADHIVDFKALQGLSHDNNTSTTLGATLEDWQIAVTCVPDKSFLLVLVALNFLFACWPSNPYNPGPSGAEPKRYEQKVPRSYEEARL